MPPPVREKLPKPTMPADALWVFDGEVYVGKQRVTEADAVDRLEAALSYAVAGNPVSQHIETIRNAVKLSRFGDNATANLELALAGIQRVFALQFDESDTFDKYDSDQPRVLPAAVAKAGSGPAGQTRDHPIRATRHHHRCTTRSRPSTTLVATKWQGLLPKRLAQQRAMGTFP